LLIQNRMALDEVSVTSVGRHERRHELMRFRAHSNQR